MTDEPCVDVRERRGEDVAACVALATTVQATDGYPSFLGDGSIDAFVAPKDALGAWVAVVDGAVVGTVSLRPRSAPSSAAIAADALGVPQGRLAFIARLMVDPTVRRRGIARRLLDVAVDEARRRELVCVLDVVSHDRAAVALYRASGWRHLGHETITMRDGRELPLDTFAAPCP